MLLYILNESDSWSYKIGHTKSKTAEHRKKSLQTGNKKKIEIIWTYESEYANQIEIMLHRNYAWCRNEGEWFLFDETNIEEVKERAKVFEEILIELNNEKENSNRY